MTGRLGNAQRPFQQEHVCLANVPAVGSRMAIWSGRDRSRDSARFNLEVGLHVVDREYGGRLWEPVVGDNGSKGDVFKTSIATIG
jgi:hypothetical protein